jgi:outer membrane protein OmpA-like peptidoglycan-associated protein
MPGNSVEASATAPDYLPGKVAFAIPASYKGQTVRKYVLLSPIPRKEPPKDTARDVVTVYFDFDDARLTEDAQNTLDAFVAGTLQPLMAAEGEADIRLDAHTDDLGTEPYNIALSKRRGAAVSRYLRDHKIPLGWIAVNAHGETAPAAANDTDEGRRRNRRVEIRLTAKDKK